MLKTSFYSYHADIFKEKSFDERIIIISIISKQVRAYFIADGDLQHGYYLSNTRFTKKKLDFRIK